MIYWSLFVSFFKVGILTFGGGYAMLPMLQREVVERRQWITMEEILDCYAIGQCTPGVIAVNTATFVGYRRKGTLGALAATVGVVTPSLLIIGVLAGIIERFSYLTMVQHAFAGIRVAVCVMMVQALVRLWRSGVKGAYGIAIFALGLVLSFFLKVGAIWIVAASFVAGIGLAWKEGRK